MNNFCTFSNQFAYTPFREYADGHIVFGRLYKIITTGCPYLEPGFLIFVGGMHIERKCIMNCLAIYQPSSSATHLLLSFVRIKVLYIANERQKDWSFEYRPGPPGRPTKHTSQYLLQES